MYENMMSTYFKTSSQSQETKRLVPTLSTGIALTRYFTTYRENITLENTMFFYYILLLYFNCIYRNPNGKGKEKVRNPKKGFRTF